MKTKIYRVFALFLMLAMMSSLLPSFDLVLTTDALSSGNSIDLRIAKFLNTNIGFYGELGSNYGLIGARSREWRQSVDHSVTGTAYCLQHGANDHAPENQSWSTVPLPIAYSIADHKAAGAFANGYPHRTIAQFKTAWGTGGAGWGGNAPAWAGNIDTLTEDGLIYATQLSLWCLLGQLRIDSVWLETELRVRRPDAEQLIADYLVPTVTGERLNLDTAGTNADQKAVIAAINVILLNALGWDMAQSPVMYMRYQDNAHGSHLTIPLGAQTLQQVAQTPGNSYGLEIVTVGGTQYIARKFIAASATSTLANDLSIDVAVLSGPPGTIIVGTDNQTLPTRQNENNITLYKVPAANRAETGLNGNGIEYPAVFKVCVPVAGCPAEGMVNLQAEGLAAQYDIYYVDAYGASQPYIIGDVPNIWQTANGTFEWTRNEITEESGTIQITKLNNGQPYPGVVFRLTGSNGDSSERTTNTNGIIKWESLKIYDTGNVPITYTITELSNPDGYPLIAPITNIMLDNSPAYSVTRENYAPNTGDPVVLYKKDARSNAPLSGATFQFRQIDGGFRTAGTTDFTGRIVLKNGQLTPGYYEVWETAAPEGYDLDSTAQTLRWDGMNSVTLTFTNVRKPSIRLIKVDEDDNRTLVGVSFDVYKDGKLITSVTTNLAGQAVVNGVTEGYYEFIETSTIPGYILDSTPKGIHVDPYDPATQDDPVLIVTKKKQPSLIVWKYDEQTAKPLPNTEFSIAYKGGSIIYEGLTNEEGFIRLDNLDEGWLTITELAPPPGWLLSNPASRDVYLEPGKVVEIKFDNLKCPTLTIYKKDSVTGDPIKGVKMNVQFSPSVNFTGGVIDFGNYITDEAGRILLNSNLQSGWYRCSELEAAQGYTLKEPIVQDIFLAGGENKTLYFENIPKSALIIRKIGTDGLPLAGATFTVKYLGGTSGSGGTLIATKVTGVNGTIILTGLEPGTYIVEETIPAPGHELSNPAVQTAFISDDEQCLVELVFSNAKMGRLVIEKRSSAANHLPIAGVTFKVTGSGGTVIGPNNGLYTTDASGQIIIDEWLSIGSTVIVTEVSGPEEYNLDAPPQSVKIQEGAVHTLLLQQSKIRLADHQDGDRQQKRFEGCTFPRSQSQW